MDLLVRHVEKHLMLSFEMLEKLIGYCPDGLWNKKGGGFVFWQQLLHVLCGLLFWTRQAAGDFVEPFRDREVFPELDSDPVGHLSKQEIGRLSAEAKEQCRSPFDAKDDNWLRSANVLFGGLLNIDVVLMQIRHMQYHVGHCNSILRQNRVRAVEWLDYTGDGATA